MGAIIYWGLIRFSIVLVATWALIIYAPNYGDWWTMFFVGVAVVVIYPAQLAYRQHIKSTKRAAQNGLCAGCRHFVPDSSLCGALDVHVTATFTPCEGSLWEPIQSQY